MKEKPYIMAPMIHSRNYIESRKQDSTQLLKGGYVEPKVDLAKYYMVGGEIVRDEVLGNALEGRCLKTMRDELALEFEACEKLGSSNVRKFLKTVDEVGQTLLLSMIPAEKLFHYGFTGIKIVKDSKLVATLLPKVANLNQVFVDGVKSGVRKFIPSKIDKASKAIEKYLGKNPRFINNKKTGNKVIMSKDGKRQVRFDININNDAPHFHLEILKKNGKFGDAIKNIHRIYFKK
jgi:hypothetical protein